MLTFALAALAAAAPAAAVDYQLTPIVQDGRLTALEVQLAFDGDADGETSLALPGQWAGTDGLWKQVRDISVEGASAREDGPAARVLRHAPGGRITVRYRVVGVGEGEPDADASKANPIVRPGWFYAHGEGLFAHPEGREAAPITFRWGLRPSGWTLASDLEHVANRGGTVEDAVESIAFGAPDLRVTTRTVLGAPLRVAVRGEWPSSDAAVADLAERIVAASNGFWGDPGAPFLLTVAPLTGGVNGRISTNGTGRGDAFAVLSTTNVDMTKEAFFLSHEYQHTWIARQLGAAPETDEALEYWFSEGFTDHYASRNLLRSGVWTLKEVLAKDNDILARYASSPARTLTSAQIMPKFWTDQDAQQAPYDRGRLLALVLDAQAKRVSGGKVGLDEVMNAQRAAARANTAAGRKTTPAVLFAATYRKVAGADAEALIARHVAAGEPIVLPGDVYGRCVEVRGVQVPVFDRGFDGQASAASGVITGVDPAGPAYRAGLRDGMKRLGREGGKEGDSRVEIGYRVADATGERWIRYRPEGRTAVAMQQLYLKPGVDDAAAAACVKDLLAR